MNDVEVTFKYTGQESFKLNTNQIQEDVVRAKMGLTPHPENDKENINTLSVEEFDKVLYDCGIESIKPSDGSQYVEVMNNERF